MANKIIQRALLLSVVYLSCVLCHAARASGQYEFCVTVTSQSGAVTYHAMMPYGDIDPGKEVARVLVTQHYAGQAGVTSVGTGDYNPGSCTNARQNDTFSVTATGQQLQDLGNAIGSGNPASIASASASIIVGVSSNVIQGAGGVVQKACNWVAGIFGGHC